MRRLPGLETDTPECESGIREGALKAAGRRPEQLDSNLEGVRIVLDKLAEPGDHGEAAAEQLRPQSKELNAHSNSCLATMFLVPPQVWIRSLRRVVLN